MHTGYAGRRERWLVSADDLFRGSTPVQSAEDLAADIVFEDGELQEFLTDLAAMRRTDRREQTPR